MCKLAKINHRFSKYPPLPVVQCIGYNEKKEQNEEQQID